MLEEPFLSTMVPADAPKMYKPYIHRHRKVSITTGSPGGGEVGTLCESISLGHNDEANECKKEKENGYLYGAESRCIVVQQQAN
jgi:hypothetical protein